MDSFFSVQLLQQQPRSPELSALLEQVCMLNGHLRKASAENVTLKNLLALERDSFAKRTSDLKHAMDEYSRCAAEALKARREMEASTRDTLAATQTHVLVATRQQKKAENVARDLKVTAPSSSTVCR